ncbi:hypothetical protein HPB47_000781 [Ixodes persulcatus]|uniref:Uncharacterized protein n=1 Tax=Ixodes persulcatus TaxID=34615 RepID=A0AC60PSC5_IXOPE|nr:hypothetical protein HPB47_000781 [Ixodes persulcatus]
MAALGDRLPQQVARGNSDKDRHYLDDHRSLVCCPREEQQRHHEQLKNRTTPVSVEPSTTPAITTTEEPASL